MRTYLILFFLVFFSTPIFAVEIQGITGDELKNAQNRLAVLAKESPNEFNKKAPKNIQEALEPFGFFNARVMRQGGTRFRVMPGPQMSITSIDISLTGEGKNNSVLKNYVKNFPVKKGQPLLTENYKNAKQALFNLALKQGYLSAQFDTQKININLSRYTSHITVVLNTGPRYYFGLVSFSDTPLSENFLRRYLNFKQGEPFSSDKLLTLQNTLAGSNYFQSALVESKPDKAQQYQVPIKIKLLMRKARQYLLGLGFGTDTGPRLTAGLNARYLNSEGHYFNSQMVLSPVQSSLQASYVIPGSNPATDQYSLNGSMVANRLNQGESRTEQLGFNNTKLIGEGWQRTYFVNYNIEQFQFNNQPGQSSYLLIPGINLTHITGQNRIFTTQGNRFSINIQGSARGTFSNNTFFQAEVQDKYITHFTDNDRMIVRGDVGYTAVDDLTSFPLSLRFYAGGAQSVRGFSYQSLGPGKYLAVGSVEYQHRIKGDWYGAAFFDAGNAMDDFDQPFARSTGVGVMWASPIGPMELTLAKAISLPGQPMRIQFVMSPDL